MTLKQDAYGNLHYTAPAFKPVPPENAFDKKRARERGLPSFARVEIPICGNMVLLQCVEHLEAMLREVRRMAQDSSTHENTTAALVVAEIRHASNKCRALGEKPRTK